MINEYSEWKNGPRIFALTRDYIDNSPMLNSYPEPEDDFQKNNWEFQSSQKYNQIKMNESFLTAVSKENKNLTNAFQQFSNMIEDEKQINYLQVVLSSKYEKVRELYEINLE